MIEGSTAASSASRTAGIRAVPPPRRSAPSTPGSWRLRRGAPASAGPGRGRHTRGHGPAAGRDRSGHRPWIARPTAASGRVCTDFPPPRTDARPDTSSCRADNHGRGFSTYMAVWAVGEFPPDAPAPGVPRQWPAAARQLCRHSLGGRRTPRAAPGKLSEQRRARPRTDEGRQASSAGRKPPLEAVEPPGASASGGGYARRVRPVETG